MPKVVELWFFLSLDWFSSSVLNLYTLDLEVLLTNSSLSLHLKLMYIKQGQHWRQSSTIGTCKGSNSLTLAKFELKLKSVRLTRKTTLNMLV